MGLEEYVRSNRIITGNDDAFSRGVGAIGSLPAKAIMLSPSMGTYPREGTINAIKDYVQNSTLENVTVRIGHSSLWEDTKRLFTDKRLKDISLFGRVLVGVPSTLLDGLYAKLTRSDYYNPFTKTVHVYSDVKAVARHELGHAQDVTSRRYPTLYTLARYIPGVALVQEYIASRYAHRATPLGEQWQTGRYLFPAFGTYVGGTIAAVRELFRPASPLTDTLLVIGGALVGHAVGAVYNAAKTVRSWFSSWRRPSYA